MSTKTRKKVRCDCKACNGKLVEERTRNKHVELESRLASSISGFEPANNPFFLIPKPNITLEIDHDPVIEGSSRKISSEAEQDESRNLFDDNYEPVFVDFEQDIPQKKRRRQDQFRELEAMLLDNQHDENSSSSSGDESLVEDYGNESDIPSEDDIFLSDDEIPVEQFTAPDFDSDSESEYPDTNIGFADSWILLWIFKYQARFRLPDVAIDSLIKFFQQILKDADRIRFQSFPSSSYTARKLLKIGKRSKIYAVCPNCNTLYNTTEVVAEEEFKFTHIEFPMQQDPAYF